jgi:hypothetical protein
MGPLDAPPSLALVAAVAASISVLNNLGFQDLRTANPVVNTQQTKIVRI